MKSELKDDLTVKEILKDFEYSELEGKGLFGWGGKLTIQPEYQRHFIYQNLNREVPVIQSLINGYPIGLLYFAQTGKDTYEVLDGQQRITSIGRFLTGKFPILDEHGFPQYIDTLPKEIREKILDTKLTIYICDGTEKEIKDWFRAVNLQGIDLSPQEILNSVYSGPFVSAARGEFSNKQNSNLQKWSKFIKGDIDRQEYLETALRWVSHDNIEEYMSKHRFNPDITELKDHFNMVITWAEKIFLKNPLDVYFSDTKLQKWGELYDKYGNNSYDPDEVSKLMVNLYSDDYVASKKGIYEYILSGCTKTELLNVRLFDEPTKKTVYAKQTAYAKEKNISNCPLCAEGNGANKHKIYKYKDMEADHVSAWSSGGNTSIENCTMLCITHNRAKGNK